MKPGGVVFLSLKQGSQYRSAVVDDGYSVRTFYYYTKETVLECAGELYSPVFYDEQVLKEPWFTLILQRAA